MKKLLKVLLIPARHSKTRFILCDINSPDFVKDVTTGFRNISKMIKEKESNKDAPK